MVERTIVKFMRNGVSYTPPAGAPKIGAGIYHDEESGLISLSSDGENWITIADRNLGATTSDVSLQGSYGNYYSRGATEDRNNKVATGYTMQENWSQGEQSVVPSGYKIPTRQDWTDVITILQTLLEETNLNYNHAMKYLKLPRSGQMLVNEDFVSYNETAGGGYYWTQDYTGTTGYLLRSTANLLSATGEPVEFPRGFVLRLFKTTPVTPDEKWDVVYNEGGILGEVFGNGKDGDLTITEDTWLPAKEYHFDNLTVCSGATLRFRGNGVPIIRAKSSIINCGTIDSRALDYITGCTVCSYSGGEVVKVANTGNLGFIDIPIGQGGGLGGGNGGGAGEQGCSGGGTTVGGAAAECAGGGGAGGSDGTCPATNGGNATACIGGNGGCGQSFVSSERGATGYVGRGGGGGYGYLKGGDGGQGGLACCLSHNYGYACGNGGDGGNGGDSFRCGGKGGMGGYGNNRYQGGGRGGKGGDAMGTLECFKAGCYALGGEGGEGGGRSGNGGTGGNVMYGCAGAGGVAGGGGCWGGKGGDGGSAYCGRGGRGGDGRSGTYSGDGGNGGGVVFGRGGDGGNGAYGGGCYATGGRGGDALRGTGGNGGGGGYGNVGGNVYHGTPGNGNGGRDGANGGSALGGVYGLFLISPIIKNNTIVACGSKGGTGYGSRGCGGNGGPGGCVVIRYSSEISQGTILTNGGAGGDANCRCACPGNAGADGSYSISQISKDWIA